MKIGIDARMLGEEQTGIGLYIKKLIENIIKFDKENEYVFFLRDDNYDSIDTSDLRFKKVLTNSKWYSFSEQTKFLFDILKERVDIMHFPSFNAPIFYFGKRVTTIHDMTPKYFPGHKMNSFIRRKAFAAVFKRSVIASKKIIAVSLYTKKEILSYYHVLPKKIEVIYEGVPYLKKHTPKSGLSKDEFFKKYGITTPYIFYSGVWKHHKNIIGLLNAFKIVLKKHHDLKLVLGGKEDEFYQEPREVIEKLKLKDNVITPGFIEHKDMGMFLENAEAFVLPSFVEGFGFGPLEALSHGTSVVVSGSGAMPEVLGDAAIYFDPKDPNDIAAKIESILEDQNLRARLLEKGKERLKRYDWESCALETIALYNSISK